MWTIEAAGNGFVLTVNGERYPFHNYNELLNIIKINKIEDGIEILNYFTAFFPEPKWVCIFIEKTEHGTIYGYKNTQNGNVKYIVIDSSGFRKTLSSIEEARYHLNPGLSRKF